MGQIIIYHQPQECGNPFFMILNSIDGKVIQVIDLPSPSGYYYNGYEVIEQPDFLYEKTVKRCSNKYPKVGDIDNYTFEKYHGKRVAYKVIEKIEPIKDKYLNDSLLYHEYYITYKYYAKHFEKRWDSSKDEYRKEMENLGFDMSKWHVYNRRKVEYKDFLRSLFPNALNMVFVG